jgi:hypothetical protein
MLGFERRDSHTSRDRDFLNESAFLPIRKRREPMARYSKSASNDVRGAMELRKAGTLKSGKSGKTVKSKKKAIAIGLSEVRAKGKKVPRIRLRSPAADRSSPAFAID